MLPQRRRRPPHLLLAALLLAVWAADGARNGSETEAAPPSSRGVVAKEGSSALIECNVTGGHHEIKWYNSKGPLLGEGAGRRRAGKKSMDHFESVLLYAVVCI